MVEIQDAKSTNWTLDFSCYRQIKFVWFALWMLFAIINLVFNTK